jgi:PAS domain S-box-containing protein
MLLRTKILFVTALMFLIVSGTYSFLYYRNANLTATDARLKLVSEASQRAATQLGFEYAKIEDALYITSRFDIVQPAQKDDTPDSKAAREDHKIALLDLFRAVLRANPNILQLKLIGVEEGGREIVRVVRRGSAVAQWPGENQLSWGNRDDFKDAMAHRWSVAGSGELAQKQFLVSDVDYQKENGKIANPATLVQRVTTPVFLPDGTIFGFIIANIDYRRMLRGAFPDALPGSHIYIAYRDGRYFRVDARGTLQTFNLLELPKQSPVGVVADVLALTEPSGKILRPDRIAYFTSVELPHAQPNQNPIITVQMPPRDVLGSVYKQARENAALLLFICILVMALATILTRHIVKPLAALQEALEQAQATGEHLRIPQTSAGEIEKVASAFQKLLDSHIDIERKLTLVIENIGVSIITMDDAGTIMSWNSASVEIFGRPAEDVIGRNIRLLIPSLPTDMDDAALKKFRYTDGQTTGGQRYVTAKRSNGDAFPIELIISEIVVDQETILICLIRDVTELMAAEKAKSEFISTISHELRTPLTSICGALDLLQSGFLDTRPEKRSQVLGIAVKNGGQLRELINGILDFEKINSGQMHLKMENFYLDDLVQEATENCSLLADQYGVTFTLALGQKHATVTGDKGRLMQVMMNLLSNAAKFSKPGGVVEVRILHDSQQGKARVCVEDHGCGIAAKHQAKIFERFTQVDSSDQRHKGGTGLGLSIAKELAELHGGTLSVTSTVGVGSVFCLELPVASFRNASVNNIEKRYYPLSKGVLSQG